MMPLQNSTAAARLTEVGLDVYQPIPIEHMQTLVVCRGPIAFETIQLHAARGWKPPHIIVSAKEWPNIHAQMAPWMLAVPATYVHRVSEYNDVAAVLEIARQNHCQAVYPGYGFLAENAAFAQACLDQGLRWVGPLPEALRQVGDKDAAIRLAKKLGIRTIPSDDSLVAFARSSYADAIIQETVKQVLAFAQANLGRGVRLKHPAGGGGKGQAVFSAEQLRSPDAAQIITQALHALWGEVAVSDAKFDAQKGVVIELELKAPRHIEIQVLGDGHIAVHGEARDCSLQNRKYQKMIEVSLHRQGLQTAIDCEVHEGRRQKLCAQLATLGLMEQDGVKIAQDIALRGAATVEFLVDEDGEYYFLEVNPRIQVEHGVTEGIIRIKGQAVSIAALQLRVAAGERFDFTQEDIDALGYTIELRLNAWLEDLKPALGGVVNRLRFAEQAGLRVDASGLLQRTRPWTIPSYDANFTLIVQQGQDRVSVIAGLLKSLRAMTLQGNEQLRTNSASLIGMLTLMKHLPDNTEFRTNFASAWTRAVAAFLLLPEQLTAALPAKPAKGTAKVNPATQAFFYEPVLRLVNERLLAEPSLALAFGIEQAAQAKTKLSDARYLGQLAQFLNIALPTEFTEWFAALDTLDEAGSDLQRSDELTAVAVLDVKLPWVAELQRRIHLTQAALFLRQTDDLSLYIPQYLRDDNLAENLDAVLDAHLRPITMSGKQFLAPMSGTFYVASAPGQAPFVSVGDRIEPDKTVGLIEAMKMMTTIKTGVVGVVTAVLKENAQAVEAGQPLFDIEVASTMEVDQQALSERIAASKGVFHARV